MWELLILILVIAGVHWWEYRNSIQEYTFAQPAMLDRHDELSSVLQEKTPIAVEIGALPWRPEIASKATWSVAVESDGSVLEMPVNQWLTTTDSKSIANGEALAAEMELVNGLADIDAGRPWWWIPELRNCRVDILGADDVLGLTWITAERQWIGCTHNEPLTLWLVHSRYRRFLPAGSDVNPWTLTVTDAPWIGRVQYIEVTVKPGWCIGLPAHWGVAVRAANGGESWMWSANQHSAASLCASMLG
jgi:hypothetical protein